MRESNPPRETKNSGANWGRTWRTAQVYGKQITNRKKERKYLTGKRGAETERYGAQHDSKRETTVTELAEGNSSSLLITCRRCLWMASTAGAERQRSSACNRRWAATSSVCRKQGVAASLLFLMSDMLFTAAVSPEAMGEGRRAQLEWDWVFARVSPVPKHDRRSSSAKS